MTVRPVKIVPLNNPCEYCGPGDSACESGQDAVHEYNGRKLCGFHSPYDVTTADRAEQKEISPLVRWEVTLTRVNPNTGETVNTFTWGRTRPEAYVRITSEFDANPDVWNGWNFTVAAFPTIITPAR